MAIKLGELLLKEKLITPEQLDEALKSQVIFGVKLGSSLVELGYITDEQLCTFLSQKLGVPFAGPRALSSVPADVLALVPAEMAEKYRVVPIKIDGKKLALAMSDPTDFKAIDEVSFVTGCVIHTYIVPDVRITSALSRLYHIRGDIRYVRIEAEVASKRRISSKDVEIQQPEMIEIPMMSESGELLNVQIPLEFEGFAHLPEYKESGYSDSNSIDCYSVDQLSLDFASAKNRDQVADVFVKYLGQEFTVCALFIIRNNTAVGWRGISSGSKIEDLDKLSLLLSKPSVLRDVFESQQFEIGTLIHTPENAQLLKALSISSQTPILVVPVVMHRKIVAAVVVSADMDALGKRLQELQKLVYKASLAFEMLIIKSKIMAT
ncbi:MAG: hypothetical protein GJV46_04650 [Geobacter sp.]|nr:hypothetical protein [Geobacter sp.]